MKKSLLLISLLLGAWGTMSAQQEVDTLGLMNTVMEKVNAKSRYIPQVHGVIKFGYEGQFSPSTDPSNAFVFNTAWAGIKGNPFDWFDYNFQFDFGNLQLVDLHLNFHPLAHLKLKSSYFNIFVGQAKTPVSLDNNYGPGNNEAINYSQVTLALLGFNSKLTPEIEQLRYGRDMGFAFYGQAIKVNWGGKAHDFLDYKIGVYNGSGAGFKALQSDQYMDYSGWLYLHPIKEITLGGSGYLGTYNQEIGGKQIKTERYRWAASFRYQDAHWAARTEYIGGKTHDQYSDGWYGLLQYTFNPGSGNKFWNQWSIVARYDAYRANYKLAPEAISHNTMIGFNYRPMKYLYIQGQYNYRFSQVGDNLKPNYHMFQLLAGLIL